MKFVLMLVQDARSWDEEPQAEKDRVYNEHMKVCVQLEAQGKLLGSQRLRPSKEAKTVRIRKGKRLITGGPYCETREQTGGEYLIECASIGRSARMGDEDAALRQPRLRCHRGQADLGMTDDFHSLRQ